MTLNNLVGNECPTEIAKLINAIIAQKATNSLDNLDAAGQQKFTDLANSITNVNDLVTALSALVNTKLSAEALLSQNGYIKFSKGLILQWGKAKSSSNNSIKFPIAMTTTYSLIGTVIDANDSTACVLEIGSVSKTGFTPHTMYASSVHVIKYDLNFFWLCIGK